MSLLRPVLNGYLRLTEKPHLQRAAGPEVLRRSFETKARLLFHPPRSMSLAWQDIGCGDTLVVQPRRGPTPEATILYLHGGGFVFGSPDTHSAMVASLAARCGARAILPRYPLAPEHPFPAALDHITSVYHHLRAQGGPLIVGGDSAGGGLTFSLLARLMAENAPLPDAVFALSPLTDLTFSGDSVATNADAEVILPAERAHEMVDMYLGDADPSDPLASPLFAELAGAPPVWITAGDTEILVDDSRRMAAHLQAQGVQVEFVEEVDLPHVWPIFHNTLPEARRTLDALAAWITAQTSARAPTR